MRITQELARKAVRAPEALSEAYDYARSSSFSRGLRLELNSSRLLASEGATWKDAVQARLCRPDLLVEMEAAAVLRRE